MVILRFMTVTSLGAREIDGVLFRLVYATEVVWKCPPFSENYLMSVTPSPSKTEMQVTSIRFERELIERLKALAGRESYQALVRDVLWTFVNEQEHSEVVQRSQIRSVVSAIAYRKETCVLTGEVIEVGEDMLLGLLDDARWVPIGWDVMDELSTLD